MKCQSKSNRPLFDSVIKKYKLTKQSIIFDVQKNEFICQIDRGIFADLHTNSLILHLDPDKYKNTWALDKKHLTKIKCYFAEIHKSDIIQTFLLEDEYNFIIAREYSKQRTTKISTTSKLKAAHDYCDRNQYILKIYYNHLELSYIDAVSVINSWT